MFEPAVSKAREYRRFEKGPSSAKLGFEVIMLNRANVLAGHLQTHPFIVAKTAIRELTAADSGMIRNCLRTRACFPGWIRFVFSDWLGSRV